MDASKARVSWSLPPFRSSPSTKSLTRFITAGRALERWLRRLVAEHGDRLLPVDVEVAEEWGRLNVPQPLPVIDALLAATAKVHGLTLATRNVKDVTRTGVDWFNPFEPQRRVGAQADGRLAL